MRPSMRFLDEQLLDKIVAEAYSILCETGFIIGHEKARSLLLDSGARIDEKTGRLLYTSSMIDSALRSTPKSFSLYDIYGNQATDFSGQNIHYTPGSSALTVLDPDTKKIRTPLTADYIDYAKVVHQLPNLATQSTAFIPSDVPEEISDSYRLYLSLMYGSKPVVTGIFSTPSLDIMIKMQMLVRGTAEALKNKPLTIFTACPVTPLEWGDEALETIFACGEFGIPVEVIAMPLAGFISPVTLSGTLIQHAAEVLSGIVMAQLANPGAPVLYGSSSTIFDVRYETTPMGSVEAMMLGCGVNEVGTRFGFPTQAYTSLSDAKVLDAQAGLESGMGATMAAMSGINNISGPGMLDFESCHSTEKLILDNEICGMALRMVKGIKSKEDIPVRPLIEELLSEDHLLISEHSMKHLKTEHYHPGSVIDRMNLSRWESEGSKSLFERAHEQRLKMVENYSATSMSDDVKKEITGLMSKAAQKYGMEKLPKQQ